MTDEEDTPTEEEITRMVYADIFSQLLESPRFQRFLQINYDIQKFVNDEEKTIEYRVIEIPPVIARDKLKELLKEHAEGEESEIISADLEDLKELEKQFSKDSND